MAIRANAHQKPAPPSSICASRRSAFGDTTQPTHTPIRQIEILLDVASVEVFVNEGEASLTAYAFSGPPKIRVTAHRAPVTFHDAHIAELISNWL